MIKHSLRHGDESHSFMVEGMVGGTRSRGRSRIKYLQWTQRYGEWRGKTEKTFVVKRKSVKNQSPDCKQKKIYT